MGKMERNYSIPGPAKLFIGSIGAVIGFLMGLPLLIFVMAGISQIFGAGSMLIDSAFAMLVVGLLFLFLLKFFNPTKWFTLGLIIGVVGAYIYAYLYIISGVFSSLLGGLP